MNRVLLHMYACRCQRAAEKHAAIQEVADAIEGIIGDDIVEVFVPSPAELSEFNEPVAFYVKSEGPYDLDSIDTAASEIAEILLELAGKFSAAAAKLARHGGIQ